MAKVKLSQEVNRLVRVYADEKMIYNKIGDTVTISRSTLGRLVIQARALDLLSKDEKAQLLEMEKEGRE